MVNAVSERFGHCALSELEKADLFAAIATDTVLQRQDSMGGKKEKGGKFGIRSKLFQIIMHVLSMLGMQVSLFVFWLPVAHFCPGCVVLAWECLVFSTIPFGCQLYSRFFLQITATCRSECSKEPHRFAFTTADLLPTGVKVSVSLCYACALSVCVLSACVSLCVDHVCLRFHQFF